MIDLYGHLSRDALYVLTINDFVLLSDAHASIVIAFAVGVFRSFHCLAFMPILRLTKHLSQSNRMRYQHVPTTSFQRRRAIHKRCRGLQQRWQSGRRP